MSKISCNVYKNCENENHQLILPAKCVSSPAIKVGGANGSCFAKEGQVYTDNFQTVNAPEEYESCRDCVQARTVLHMPFKGAEGSKVLYNLSLIPMPLEVHGNVSIRNGFTTNTSHQSYLELKPYWELFGGNYCIEFNLKVNTHMCARVLQIIGRTDWPLPLNRDRLEFTYEDEKLKVKYYRNNFNEGEIDYNLPLHKKIHVAFTKSGTNHRLFINGIQVGMFLSDEPLGKIRNILVGGDPDEGFGFDGSIDNLVIVKNSAQYTQNFTEAKPYLPSPDLQAIIPELLRFRYNERPVDISYSHRRIELEKLKTSNEGFHFSQNVELDTDYLDTENYTVMTVLKPFSGFPLSHYFEGADYFVETTKHILLEITQEHILVNGAKVGVGTRGKLIDSPLFKDTELQMFKCFVKELLIFERQLTQIESAQMYGYIDREHKVL